MHVLSKGFMKIYNSIIGVTLGSIFSIELLHNVEWKKIILLPNAVQ